MTTVNIYLTFNGNCEEAFNFYKSVFGGEFSYLSKRGDVPLPEGIISLTDEDKKRIMHISLPISNETTLMGDDIMQENPQNIVFGNNFSITVTPDSRKEADRLFRELSASGQIGMPMQEMFWGTYFGILTDRFGINWMIDTK